MGFYVVAPRRGRGVQVRVRVPDPPGPWAVSRALAAGGVVDHPRLFTLVLLGSGAASRVRPGELVLRDDLAPRAVLRALATGSAGVVRVTFPEGYTRFEMARRLEERGVLRAAEFLARTEDPAVLRAHGVEGDSLEGYLFPETYDFPLGARADEVVRRMVGLFERRFGELVERHPGALARAAALGGSDPARALLVLASLVERETGAAQDRARVARVFWNRLTLPGFRPRLLQSDPTVLYGCVVEARAECAPGDAGARGGITAAMLASDANRYNTYRREGLPPGPICNPGARSLEAALAPVEGGDLYFVARGDGRSAFAATLEEHRRNVQRYLRR